MAEKVSPYACSSIWYTATIFSDGLGHAYNQGTKRGESLMNIYPSLLLVFIGHKAHLTDSLVEHCANTRRDLRPLRRKHCLGELYTWPRWDTQWPILLYRKYHVLTCNIYPAGSQLSNISPLSHFTDSPSYPSLPGSFSLSSFSSLPLSSPLFFPSYFSLGEPQSKPPISLSLPYIQRYSTQLTTPLYVSRTEIPHLPLILSVAGVMAAEKSLIPTGGCYVRF